MLAHLRSDPAYMPQEIGHQLAALIYLRWADFQEAECEAIASFDGAEYTPALPASAHWRSWYSFTPDRLKQLLGDELPARLRSLRNDRQNPLATYLHHMSTAVERLGSLPPQALLPLVDWLAKQPFETPTDRRALLDIMSARPVP